VADLLAARDLGLVEIVPAAPVRVRWMATSELRDPSAFLQGGEVLLTTGLGWDAAADWSGYASAVAAAGVVAVGFGAGLSHAAVPPGLVRAARCAGLGVFVVPRPTPFIAVTKAFVDLLHAEDQDAAGAAVIDQRELAHAATQPDSTVRVLRRLAQAVAGEALLVDPRGVPLARSDPGAAPPPDLPRALAALSAQGLRGALSEHGPDGALVIHPIGLRGRPGSYLVVRAPTGLGHAQRSTVTTAVALLGLDAETAAAARDSDRRLRACAISLLLRGESDAGRRVLAAAAHAPGSRKAGVPDLEPRVCVLKASGRADATAEALALVEQEAHDAKAGVVVAPDEDSAGALTVVMRQGPAVARVEDLLLSAGCRVGTGSAALLAAAGTSEATAREALRRTDARRPLFRWDDTRTAGVGSVLDPASARAFAQALLGPVLAGADAQEGRTLLNTARVFLAQHGRWQPAADLLGVHRNTVRLRISRLEKLLGRSFDDMQVRTDLWIALPHVEHLDGGSGAEP
jgi:purine catabolism regulator